jgi:hypothetical protein
MVRMAALSGAFLLALAGCGVVVTSSAQSGPGKSTFTLNGQTIEVLGDVTSNTTVNNRVSIKTPTHVIRLDGRKLRINGQVIALPEFSKVVIDCRQAAVKVTADGVAVPVAEKVVGEKPPEVSQAEKFDAAQVKEIVVSGLTEKLAVKAVAPGSQIVVERCGIEEDQSKIWTELKDSTLHIRAGDGFQPALSLSMPPGVKLTIKECFGGEIGDVQAPLELHASGAGDYAVGKITDVKLVVSGVSKISVASVTGDADLSLSGAGNVTIKDGAIGRLSIVISGVGGVDCRAKAQAASFNISGAGNVTVVKPDRVDKLDTSGVGSVKFLEE